VPAGRNFGTVEIYWFLDWAQVRSPDGWRWFLLGLVFGPLAAVFRLPFLPEPWHRLVFRSGVFGTPGSHV
jgi:hypothetical protein